MNAFPIEPSHLALEIYRLILPFAASERLSRVCNQDRPDPIAQMREQFEQSEASRLLIAVAVMIRNNIAQSNSLLSSRYLNSPVGTLINDVSTMVDSQLTFREACHKIIHASDISFVDEQMNQRGVLPPLSMRIKLYGEKINKGSSVEWEANLDIVEYARLAFKLA